MYAYPDYNLLGFDSTDRLLLDKNNDQLTVLNWNICADFFTDSNGSVIRNPVYNWKQKRLPMFSIFIATYQPDIVALQELSTTQCEDIRLLGVTLGYSFVALGQHPSQVPVGCLLSGSLVTEQVGRFAGTPLLGFLVNNKLTIDTARSGCRWFNTTPDTVPTVSDRGQTDKGFGNYNTYRCLFYIAVTFQDKEIVIFNSHYPLSGGGKTRALCAELESKLVKEIAADRPFVSCGDRNFFSDRTSDPNVTDKDTLLTDRDMYSSLVTGNSIDSLVNGHYGYGTTFIGYDYDQFCNPYDGKDFARRDYLDVVYGWKAPILAALLHGGYKDGQLCTQMDRLPSNHQPGVTISDHCGLWVLYDW